MGDIRRTKGAKRDLLELWFYVADDSPTYADALLRQIERSIQLLSVHPRLGPARPEYGRRLRSYPVGNYLIFYRPTRAGIELVRVVHGARDLGIIFRKRRRG